MPSSSDLIDHEKKSQSQKTRRHSRQYPSRRLHTPPRTNYTLQWVTLPTCRRTLRTPRQPLTSGTSRRRSHDGARRSIRLRLSIVIQARRRQREPGLKRRELFLFHECEQAGVHFCFGDDPNAHVHCGREVRQACEEVGCGVGGAGG